MYLLFLHCNIDEIHNKTFPPDQAAIPRLSEAAWHMPGQELLSRPRPSLSDEARSLLRNCMTSLLVTRPMPLTCYGASCGLSV